MGGFSFAGNRSNMTAEFYPVFNSLVEIAWKKWAARF
jgi:hypothetical protein